MYAAVSQQTKWYTGEEHTKNKTKRAVTLRMKIRRVSAFLMEESARDRWFFQFAKYIPDASLDVVCFFIDERRVRHVTIYTDTVKKILRLCIAGKHNQY